MTSLGRYEILGELGRGGMAVVYSGLAHGEAGFRKPVVVKRIHPHLTRDERFVRMLIREAKLTVLLDHPNVAQVLELGREGDDYFIVLERVDGADLSRLVESAARAGITIPPALAAHVAREVLAALSYAHGARDGEGQPLGLVHRDVSPSNVLVGRDGRVKLTDFGVARAPAIGEPSRKGITGKLSYMSPEQARAEEVDARSDLYSVSLVLFELLTGQRAIRGDGDMALWQAACDGPAGALREAELPEGFRPVLERALHAEPGERYPDARALREALAPLADEVERGQERLSELITLLAPESPEEPITRSLDPPAKTTSDRTTPMPAETLVTRVDRESPKPPGLAALERERVAASPGWTRWAALAAILSLVGGLGWLAVRTSGRGGDEPGEPGREVEATRDAEAEPAPVGEVSQGVMVPIDAPPGEVSPDPARREPSPSRNRGHRGAEDPISTFDNDGIAMAKGAGDGGGTEPAGTGTLSVIVQGATGQVHVTAPGWIDGYTGIHQRSVQAGTWTVTVVNPAAEPALDWTGEVTVVLDDHVGVLLRRVDGEWRATVR